MGYVHQLMAIIAGADEVGEVIIMAMCLSVSLCSQDILKTNNSKQTKWKSRAWTKDQFWANLDI